MLMRSDALNSETNVKGNHIVKIQTMRNGMKYLDRKIFFAVMGKNTAYS